MTEPRNFDRVIPRRGRSTAFDSINPTPAYRLASRGGFFLPSPMCVKRGGGCGECEDCVAYDRALGA